MTTTIARMRRDGTLVRVNPDGTEEVLSIPAPTPMTEAEIEAAAWADPDARPFTTEELAKVRRVPRIKTLRRALGLTQEEFATHYHIPVGTLRDWEQGRSEPDQPARAYLHVIASDPEGVRHALEANPSIARSEVVVTGRKTTPAKPPSNREANTAGRALATGNATPTQIRSIAGRIEAGRAAASRKRK